MAESQKSKTSPNTAAPDMLASIMAEGAQFLSTRLQHDLETQKAMMACKTPVELMQVQSEFFKTAMAQYTEYATGLQSKMMATTEAATKTAQANTARAYNDVPL